jgi:hypothetical protein
LMLYQALLVGWVKLCVPRRRRSLARCVCLGIRCARCVVRRLSRRRSSVWRWRIAGGRSFVAELLLVLDLGVGVAAVRTRRAEVVLRVRLCARGVVGRVLWLLVRW